jgi:hypothetical protein
MTEEDAKPFPAASNGWKRSRRRRIINRHSEVGKIGSAGPFGERSESAGPERVPWLSRRPGSTRRHSKTTSWISHDARGILEALLGVLLAKRSPSLFELASITSIGHCTAARLQRMCCPRAR